MVLEALNANAEDIAYMERCYAAEALSVRSIQYCRGRGCSVITITTMEQWEQRDILSVPISRRH